MIAVLPWKKSDAAQRVPLCSTEQRTLISLGQDQRNDIVGGFINNLRMFIFTRQGMPISDKVKTLVILLKRAPVIEGPVDVAKMQFASRSHAADNSLFPHCLFLQMHTSDRPQPGQAGAIHSGKLGYRLHVPFLISQFRIYSSPPVRHSGFESNFCQNKQAFFHRDEPTSRLPNLLSTNSISSCLVLTSPPNFASRMLSNISLKRGPGS